MERLIRPKQFSASLVLVYFSSFLFLFRSSSIPIHLQFSSNGIQKVLLFPYLPYFHNLTIYFNKNNISLVNCLNFLLYYFCINIITHNSFSIDKLFLEFKIIIYILLNIINLQISLIDKLKLKKVMKK